MAKQKKRNSGEHIARMENRKKESERLTNWYMINLCWGVVGIIALLVVNSGYGSNLILYMPTILWSLVGVFAAATLVVLGLGAKGVIANRSRANNYAILLGVCSGVSLWLALYNKIRVVMENVLKSITGNDALMVVSYWNIWIPMIAIGIYLVVAFIWYLIKLRRL